MMKILEIKEVDRYYSNDDSHLVRLNADDEENTLERAIIIAQTFVEDFLPFTYYDIGCGKKRTYRDEFCRWASKNSIEFSQPSIPGQKGFGGMTFYPYFIDDKTGEKVLAEYPAEEQDS